MASIDKEMIQKQLNKSIEILEMTFDKFNLQVIGYEFSGYDTIHMYLNEDNLAFNMVKCRIFATRG